MIVPCFFILIFMAEIQCQVPPSVDYAVSHGESTTYMSQWSYTCLDGRRFEDGHATKPIVCKAMGMWSEDGFTCECKHTI